MNEAKNQQILIDSIREWMRALHVSQDFTFDDLIYVHKDYSCFVYEYVKNGLKIRVSKELI